MDDILGNIAAVKKTTSDLTKDEEAIQRVFGSDDSPLSFVIQPRAHVVTDDNTPEDFEDLF